MGGGPPKKSSMYEVLRQGTAWMKGLEDQCTWNMEDEEIGVMIP